MICKIYILLPPWVLHDFQPLCAVETLYPSYFPLMDNNIKNIPTGYLMLVRLFAQCLALTAVAALTAWLDVLEVDGRDAYVCWVGGNSIKALYSTFCVFITWAFQFIPTHICYENNLPWNLAAGLTGPLRAQCWGLAVWVLLLFKWDLIIFHLLCTVSRLAHYTGTGVGSNTRNGLQKQMVSAPLLDGFPHHFPFPITIAEVNLHCLKRRLYTIKSRLLKELLLISLIKYWQLNQIARSGCLHRTR